MRAYPGKRERDIFGAARPGRFVGEAIFHIHGHEALAREPVANVVVNLSVHTLAAAHECATMHEQHGLARRALTLAAFRRRIEHVQHLARVRPVGDLALHARALLRRGGHHGRITVDHSLAMPNDVVVPALTQFEHLPAHLRRQRTERFLCDAVFAHHDTLTFPLMKVWQAIR